MKIEIAHEAPLQIMKGVREMTDYDYALVHLFETNKKYYSFFEESLQMGRRVILDNSIFELGKAFDPDKFTYWINLLRPTEYIIPDVLDSTRETLRSVDNWLYNYRGVPGKKIGVVQGSSYEELKECYRGLSSSVDKIAFSFNSIYYQREYPDLDIISANVLGRFRLIKSLLDEGVINILKPHHLLGCSSRIEFLYYRSSEEFDFIKTLDTSNPVTFGIEEREYSHSNWYYKPQDKLVDHLSDYLSGSQEEIIFRNIIEFRSIVNGR